VGSVTRQIVGVPRSWRREQGLSRLHLGAGTLARWHRPGRAGERSRRMVAMNKVYHIILPHGYPLGAVIVVLGDAQGDGAVVNDGEAPGATLRLVADLVVPLGGDGAHPFRQAHAGRVGKAAGAKQDGQPIQRISG
jgi:hypothetical protein